MYRQVFKSGRPRTGTINNFSLIAWMAFWHSPVQSKSKALNLFLSVPHRAVLQSSQSLKSRSYKSQPFLEISLAVWEWRTLSSSLGLPSCLGARFFLSSEDLDIWTFSCLGTSYPHSARKFKVRMVFLSEASLLRLAIENVINTLDQCPIIWPKFP